MTSLDQGKPLNALAVGQEWFVHGEQHEALAGEQVASDALPPASVEIDTQIDVSIVIPLLNEEDSLELLYTRLTNALVELNRPYEIIMIDDGSTDRSYTILQTLQQQDPRLRVIRFRRNFGQTAAFSAGFDYARGEIIITMDADLQNDPADIPAIVAKVDEGYDVVSGWRVNRQDRFLDRRLPSQIANAMISNMTGVKLHDYGCSLKAYRQNVVKNIRLYGEMHRFIPALSNWIGVRVAEVPVNHSARQFGKSKYGLGRIMRVFLDLLTVKFLLDYATRPIQIFGLFGMICLTIGTVLGGYLSTLKVFFGATLADRPLLLLAVLLVVLGVQLITMGLIGELVMRTYYESQGKSIYSVRDVLSAKTPKQGAQQDEMEVAVGSQQAA